MRRIKKICEERWNFPTWNGELTNGQKLNGYWTFSQKPCGKEVEVLYEQEFDFDEDYIPLNRDAFGRLMPVGNRLEHLACGHSVYSIAPTKKERDSKRFLPLWNKLLPMQQRAIEDIEANNFSGYCAYDTGFGKTVIGGSLIRENLEAMLPILICCEAGDINRWKKELVKWLGVNELIAEGKVEEGIRLIPQIVTRQTIQHSISKILVTSWTNLKDEELQEFLFSRNFKTIMSDESHMFKDENSSRTQAFVKIANQTPNKIFLSATWLENKISEAFVPLNILDPVHFPGRRSLLRYCLIGDDGKPYSINPRWRQDFLDRINPYIFRMTREQAGIKLPNKKSMHEGNRDPIWVDVTEFKSNSNLAQAYNAELDKLEEEILSYKPNASTIIGMFSTLRHLTGRMKVTTGAKFVIEWLNANPGDEKICIGVHHKAVMEGLVKYLGLLNIPTLTMSDELPDKKDAIEDEWRTNPKNRVMIASILGAGKGRNFQFCKSAINLERCWNKSKELQFEGRFQRIMVDENDNIRTEFTEEDDVIIDYIMGLGLFDEYFHELVNLKGVIVDSADEAIETMPEKEFVIELARKMVMKRLKFINI